MSATNASKLLETLREMYGLEISCDSRCPFCSKEKAEEFENIYDDTKLNIIVIHNCVLCLLELLSPRLEESKKAYYDSMKFLVYNRVHLNALHLGVKYGSFNSLEILLLPYFRNITRIGPGDLIQKDCYESPIYMAIRRDRDEILKLFLDYLMEREPAILDEKMLGWGGSDVWLRRAASFGSNGCLKMLLDYKFQFGFNYEIDSSNLGGNTPLHCAARMGHPECVKILIDYGAKYDIKNNEGLTAIDIIKTKDNNDGLLGYIFPVKTKRAIKKD